MNQIEIIRRQIGALSNILLLFVWYIIGNKLGDTAIVYVAVAVGVAILFSTVVCGGIPDVAGKILRSKRNKGQYKNVHKIKQCTLLVQIVMGIFFSLLMFLLAPVLAKWVFHIEYCTLLIRVLSLFVFFKTLSSVFCGFLQGEGFELPAAVSGMIRPFLILGFSRLFYTKLAEYGMKVGNLLQDENFAAMYSGFSVVMAICVSEFLCVIFLMVLYKGCTMMEKRQNQEGMKTTDTAISCISTLFYGRYSYLISDFFVVFAFLSGVIWGNRRQGENTGFLLEFSAYVHKYWMIYGILIAVTFILSVTVLNKTFEYIRKEDKRFARISFQSGVHISMVHGVFFAIFCAVMAEQIVGVLKPTNGEIVLGMLRIGSAVVALGAVCCYYGRFLISAGKKLYAMGAIVLASVIVFIGNLIFSLIGKWSFHVSILIGIVGLAVLWFVMGNFAYRLMRVRMDWLQILIMPLGAGCISGLACMLLGKVLTPHLGDGMTLFVTLLLAIFIYWVVLLLLRNFKEQELDMIFGGKLIYALGQVLRVY